MIPQGMTNEQFALWIAVKIPSHTLETFEVAGRLYDWLEKKQEEKQEKIESNRAPLKYYNSKGEEMFRPSITDPKDWPKK